MSQSGGDDDFHSADEDGFEEEEEQGSVQMSLGREVGVGKEDKHCNEKVINRTQVDSAIEQKSLKDDNLSKESARIFRENSADDVQNDSKNNELSRETRGSDRDQDDEGSDVDDDGDEEEEALAKRIRERNLKIARKFSAEIARNLRASAPVPVKGSISASSEFSEILDPLGSKSSFQPRAPPSTPALSSSFNNLNDPTTHTTTTSPSLNAQYSWRIPSKNTIQQSGCSGTTPSTSIKAEDQARHVLDRLSEQLSQTDKNLFERVAADINKVSLKNEEVSTTTDLPSALTSITDLGSTLGGWGWSGATKLLSSASQVTSQVGSVLDSVVGGAGPASQPSNFAEDKNHSATITPANKTNSSDNKREQAPTDVTYNDPLVDLTLNAMESLGKKAFDVITTRDETGSLQIKGLGRPWEHLLSTMKTDHSSQADEHMEPTGRHSPPPQTESETIDSCNSRSTSKIRSDSPPLPSALKLRKRRHD